MTLPIHSVGFYRAMSRSPPSEINAEPSVAGGYEAPGNEDPGTERQNSPEKSMSFPLKAKILIRKRSCI